MSGERTSLPSHRLLPWLWLLFVGSGCAALIYEIVWFQLLQLVIGSSAVSLGVLLATFMGGMCAGSVLLPRLIPASRHPLRVYAVLESGIGIFGLLVLFAVPQVAHVYVASVGHGPPGILLRGAVAAICLMPPTVLMGATLPAIARWTETTLRGVSWLGLFYGGNIAGAVCGCLLAGFYLLRVHDMATATYVAVAINATVAFIAFSLPAETPPKSDASTTHSATQRRQPLSWLAYVTIALSGFCALSAEVIWTRLLSLMFGPTVYTFSIILAVFLVGLGIGSGAGSLLARGRIPPRIALGGCQALLAAAIGWAAWMIASSLPFWPINPSLSTSPWFNFQLDLVRCAWAILPPTILWGASFPLALAAVAVPGQDPGRLVGGVYAANTVGAILGAVVSSLILIAWAGTQQAQRLLIVLSALAALLMIVATLWPPRTDARGDASPRSRIKIATALFVPALIGLVGVLVWNLPKVPWQLLAHGRYLPTYSNDRIALYTGEGLNASVAVTELNNGVRNFHISGKIEASTESQDMRLQRMLGHIPALLHPKPRSVLIVGCGAGVTAGSFVNYPSIERIVICEIEQLVPPIAAKYFATENYNVVRDPRVKIIYDDARHYLLTPDKFDIITSDPIHPWVKGAATLYTEEYFQLCRRHLNPGGLVTQWVPLYESYPDVVKSEFATFFNVFPDGTIWSNDENGSGYDVVLLGPVAPMKIKVDEIQERLERVDHRPVLESLREVGFLSSMTLLGTYGGRASDLAPWLEHAEINRDRNLRLQYLAGLGLNQNEGEQINDEIVRFRKFPENLFEASDPHKETLRKLLAQPKSAK